MPIVLAVLAFLASALIGASLGPSGGPLIKQNEAAEYAGQACIDEDMLGDVVLSDIPKPDKTNAPFPDTNTYGCAGQGSCTGPDLANYRFIAGAEDVVIERMWPHADSTRLVKQKLPNDAKYDGVRHLLYRASCNDWCQLGLPYGGTFHCDFLFVFKPTNPEIGNSTDWIKKRSEEGEQWYPKDGSHFQVLFREGATIPDYAGQSSDGRRAPIKCSLINTTPGATRIDGERLAEALLRPALAQAPKAQSAIRVGSVDYVLADEYGRLLKQHLRPEDQGRQRLDRNHPFRSDVYDVYKNLSLKWLPTDNLLFLTKPGDVERLEKSTNPFEQIPYLEFRRLEDVKPDNRTLQLGTFKPFLGKGWWRKWVDESKPAIYLYPEKDTLISVRLKTKGRITVSDPPYDPNNGWQGVLAHSDGSLEYQGKTYPYLFYEAVLNEVFIEPTGHLVAGSDLLAYFAEVLPKLGLNDVEAQDFSEYWMKRLSTNQPYYFIRWLGSEQIEEIEPAEFSVKPDTQIRIRAYFQPLAAPMSVNPQNLPVPAERRGFTVVEWGGILDK